MPEQDCRKVSRPDSSPTDSSLRTDPRLTFTLRIPPQRTYPWPDNSPTGHFRNKTFLRPDISPTTTILKFLHFFAKLFFETDGLDFPLIFLGLLFYQYFLFTHSWFTKRLICYRLPVNLLLLFSLMSAIMCISTDLKIPSYVCVFIKISHS